VAKLRVELVSPEREIWAGEADMVVAKTLDGEIGILPGHSPVLGVMVDGSVVRITPTDDGETISAMVSGGFLSVASNEVSVLAEYAELGGEIDVNAAREEYERAAGLEGDEAAVAQRRARARLRAAGQEV
jgi:F-type H+-transporting ATPase subunit epsilon